MTNIMKALLILSSLNETIRLVVDIIKEAQQAGRDITEEELNRIGQRQDEVHASFLQELQRRREEG